MRCVDLVRQRRGGLVLLEGEPGMGKSRLVEELQHRWGGQGAGGGLEWQRRCLFVCFCYGRVAARVAAACYKFGHPIVGPGWAWQGLSAVHARVP